MTKTDEYEFEIIHLDGFPYGGINKVRFNLGGTDVTEAMSKLLDAYWTQFCDLEEGCKYDPDENVALIVTGEGFCTDDFAACIEDVVNLNVISRECEEEN